MNSSFIGRWVGVKFIQCLVFPLVVLPCLAQGTVNFSNRIPNVLDAPVILFNDSTKGAGTIPGATVQLLLIEGTSVTPIGSALSFRASSDELAKYFDGGLRQIPGTFARDVVTLRIRVLSSAPNVPTTDSANFQQLLGGGGIPPENMMNLVGFSMGVPEPSTFALGILGSAGLLAFRRRNSVRTVQTPPTPNYMSEHN